MNSEPADQNVVADASKENSSGGGRSLDKEQVSTWHGILNSLSRSKRLKRVEKDKQPPITTWQTKFLRYGPLMGMGSLLLAFSTIFASLAILVTSNNKHEALWKYPPSTYLAILTAVANQSLRYAALEGVAIAWWVKALNGSTISRLHHDWSMGTGIWSALTSGKRFNLLALACIVSIFVAVDGPLLQQSTRIIASPMPPDIPVELKFTASPEVPANFTGMLYFPQEQTFNIDHHEEMSSVYMNNTWPAWKNNASMENFVEGCEETCKATFSAPAFQQEYCEYATGDVDYGAALSKDDPWQLTTLGDASVAPVLRAAYYVNLTWGADSNGESLNFTRLVADVDDCAGTYNYTSCVLRSAIGEYEVDIRRSLMSVNNQVTQPRMISIANNTSTVKDLETQLGYRNRTVFKEFGGWQTTTLSGLAKLVLYDHFSSVAWGPNGTSESFFTPDGEKDAKGCQKFQDPMNDILTSLNMNMFWIGLLAPRQDYWKTEELMIAQLDTNLTYWQNVQGYKTGEWNIFKSNFYWFSAAVIVQVLCICLTFWTYWGWWTLGRAVSFSPLEVAKAFDAPLLVEYNSNMAADDMAKEAESREVRYGATGNVVVRDGIAQLESKKLAFAESREVYRPLNDFEFDS